MTKSTREATTTTGLRGRFGPVAIVLAARAATLVLLLFAVYVIAMFLAIRAVPLIMGFVKSGTGVTTSTPWDTTLMVWIAPSVVLIALLTVGTVYLVRWLWKLRARALDKIAGWALGRQDEKVTPLANARAARSKQTRNPKTKTA